jgi:dipeptidyl aminopeptidase/acylaminoacyl peptidase
VLQGGAVGSASDMFYNWLPNSQASNPSAALALDHLVQINGTPASNPEFWKAISPLEHLEDLSGPVQIHHGTNDEQVPVRFSQTLDSALTKQGLPHEYYEYPGAGHGLHGPEYRLITDRMMKLLNKQLIPTATAE